MLKCDWNKTNGKEDKYVIETKILFPRSPPLVLTWLRSQQLMKRNHML